MSFVGSILLFLRFFPGLWAISFESFNDDEPCIKTKWSPNIVDVWNSCVVLNPMIIQLRYPANSTDLNMTQEYTGPPVCQPKLMHVAGECQDDSQTISLVYGTGPSVQLNLTFTRNSSYSSSYWLGFVSGVITPLSPDPTIYLSANFSTSSLFTISLGHSYTCHKQISMDLNVSWKKPQTSTTARTPSTSATITKITSVKTTHSTSTPNTTTTMPSTTTTASNKTTSIITTSDSTSTTEITSTFESVENSQQTATLTLKPSNTIEPKLPLRFDFFRSEKSMKKQKFQPPYYCIAERELWAAVWTGLVAGSVALCAGFGILGLVVYWRRRARRNTGDQDKLIKK